MAANQPATSGVSDVGPAGAHRPAGRLGRLGDPLAWTAAEKCLFVAGMFLFLMCPYLVSFVALASRSDIAPYVDPAAGRVLVSIQVVTMVAWVVVAATAWRAHRRGGGTTALVPITILLAVWMLSYGSYFTGFYTNTFAGLTFVAAAAVGWVLFDRRTVSLAVCAVLLGVVVVSVLDQLHVVRYAPLFREAPFQAGVLDRSWVLTMGGVTFFMMLVLLGMVYFIVDRWHDREEKLAIASQQLGRANEVIGRYVASQLAEQIRSGNYGSLDQHERRKLTLFFSDIEGFAAIADNEEPEDLSALLNEYLSEMTAIGERFGATIDKFVGDAIMIFFGAPLATSDRDHALRAVRMALAMQQRMVELRARWERAGRERVFHIRIGINTGHASIGNFGSQTRMDYTAIGRQVNLAARLQAHCNPDRVLLSHSTWVLVQDEVGCVPKGEIVVKGFHEPVKVYEVEEVSPAAVSA